MAPLLPLDRLLLRLPLFNFIQNISYHRVALIGSKLLPHSPQGDADDVPVMEFGAGVPLAEFQPHVVNEIDIFRPETRRMRTKVHED